MSLNSPKGALGKKFDVVAVYDLYDDEEVKLASYLDVVQGLNDGAGRDPYFMKNIVAELDPSYSVGPHGGAFGILDGTDKNKLRLTSVLAKHEGLPTYLPMLEDMQTGKLLVVGPCAVAGAKDWAGLTYVDASAQNAATQVNDFLVAAARLRGERGEMNSDGARELVENMVKATAIMGDLKFIGAGRIVPAEATVGQCLVEIAKGDAQMGAYTMAGQKAKQPAPK